MTWKPYSQTISTKLRSSFVSLWQSQSRPNGPMDPTDSFTDSAQTLPQTQRTHGLHGLLTDSGRMPGFLTWEPVPQKPWVLVRTCTTGTFTLLGNLCLGTFTWEPSLGNLCLENLLGNLRLGTFTLEPSLGNLRLETCTWKIYLGTFACELLLRNLHLGTFAWKPVLGKFTWEPSLGNFTSEP